MKLSMSRCEINVPVGLFGFGMKMRPRSRRDCIQHRFEVLLKVRARHLDQLRAPKRRRDQFVNDKCILRGDHVIRRRR